MTEENEKIKKHVRKRYSELARRTENKFDDECTEVGCSSSCCGPAIKEDFIKDLGYSTDEILRLPARAVEAAAGCGNPTALAGLKDGEVVLDLGSGGGIDVFLAARKVGPKGKAIGVDMTQEMIDMAKKNAHELGIENIDFRLGDIEDLPLDDESVDVVISNCVINLAPDKDKVFQEVYRVLRSGGRMMISDIVTDGGLPEEVSNDLDAWAECVAGALDEKEYLGKIRDAGFEGIRVLSKQPCMDLVYSAQIEAYKATAQ